MLAMLVSISAAVGRSWRVFGDAEYHLDTVGKEDATTTGPISKTPVKLSARY